MAKRQTPIHVDTIGDVLASPRTHLYAHCRRCLHAHQLDLATIVAVHGPGLRLVHLRGRLKCQNSGLPDHPDKDRKRGRDGAG